MRWSVWLLILTCTLTVGCQEPEETIPTIMPSSGKTASNGTTSGGMTSSGMTSSGMTTSGMTDFDTSFYEPATDSGEVAAEVRFVADKSIRVENMMCPYSCWPRVKETLANQPGVEAVQLAQQPGGTEEGTISLPVVELKLADGFDFDAAIAALAKIDFEAKAVN